MKKKETSTDKPESRAPRVWDFVILAALALAALVIFLVFRAPAGGTLTARVTADGETLYEIDLGTVTEEQTLTLENGVVIALYPDGAKIVSSPCKGHDCVRAGKLTRAGQCAVCLPEKTVLLLTGAPGGGPDAITG
ncbi:MAG: NusG domain II-containing protein [Clostridia bacterium]|nr:NusG domain II-containing protein [Clostridia bacterium]